MKKVSFREAAISEILPFYGELHKWVVLLKKLSFSTSKIYSRSKEFVCNSLIQTRYTMKSVLWTIDDLNNEYSTIGQNLDLFTLKVSAEFGQWTENELFPLLNALKSMSWSKCIIVYWKEVEGFSYNRYPPQPVDDPYTPERFSSKNYYSTYSAFKQLGIKPSLTGEIEVLVPLSLKIEEVMYLTAKSTRKYPIKGLEKLKKEYIDTGKFSFKKFLFKIQLKRKDIFCGKLFLLLLQAPF
jgi:hypothetical protein